MPEETFQYIFGPVPSRRLGRSLGVDLVPFKTCTYDCIYCQLGRTTNKTITREEYVPLDNVVNEVEQSLENGSSPDYITLSGSGEPTLYSKLGRTIERVKELTDVPVAVLTNGSLLWDPEVQDEVAQADLVVPSLDAGDQQLFQYVNRPHPKIIFEQMLDGLIAFRKRFQRLIWLEVFVLGGVTAVRAEIEKIASYANKIQPDRIQLNTVARPPAEEYAFAESQEQMMKFAELFTPAAEVVADFSGVHQLEEFGATRQDVVNLLRRRPCSVSDIASGLGIHRNEVTKHVGHLLDEAAIVTELKNGTVYYRVKQ